MKPEQSVIKNVLSDDLIEIFGQSDQEILNFVGVTSEVEEYELRFTKSAEILNWEFGREYVTGETEEESFEEEYIDVDEDDKERAFTQIQATETEIAADINKYLKALKSKESLEFEQISKEEIFERLKCRCFEWNRIKKRETIKDVIKQICKAKTCKEEVKREKQEERKKLERLEDKKIWDAEKKRQKKIGICPGVVKKKSSVRKKSKKYTKKELEELASIKDKLSRETIRTDIKKFASYVQSFDTRVKDESSSSEESTSTNASSIQDTKKFLRAKDSVLLRKEDDFNVSKSAQSSTESATSTLSKNLQHLESLDKIGKRKINPKMFNMYLNEFNSIKNFAFVFIESILQEAETKANVSIIDPLEVDIKEYICTEYYCGKEDEKIPSIAGNTISLYSQVYGYDLTPHEGKTMVRDIVKYWKVRKTWKYCIHFLGQHTDSCNNYYKFEVKWSEPSFSYPVPQVTASVYFTIELSKIKPTLFPPKVTFVFESERYKFTRYDDIMHEKFLDEIIHCKTAFFKSMRY